MSRDSTGYISHCSGLNGKLGLQALCIERGQMLLGRMTGGHAYKTGSFPLVSSHTERALGDCGNNMS